MELPTLLKKDDFGNELYCLPDKKTINLRLKGKPDRKIGEIYTTKYGECYCRVEKESNTFKKIDAWGINYELFSNYITGTINIKTENGIYRIRKKHALLVGSVLKFKKQGFELQFFIPKKYFSFQSNSKMVNGKWN